VDARVVGNVQDLTIEDAAAELARYSLVTGHD
jgi:hypothetical protein